MFSVNSSTRGSSSRPVSSQNSIATKILKPRYFLSSELLVLHSMVLTHALVYVMVVQSFIIKIMIVKYNHSRNTNIQRPKFQQIHTQHKHSTSRFQNNISHQNTTVFIPDLYLITPTYNRPTQICDLTKVIQSTAVTNLNIQIIIIEDKYLKIPSPKIRKLTNRFHQFSSIRFTLLSRQSSSSGGQYKRINHRGDNQRNEAIRWIENNHKNVSAGGGGTRPIISLF